MRMMLALLLAAGFCLAAGQNATAAAGRQPAAQAPGRPTDRTRAPTSGASYYLYQEVDLSAYAAAIDAGSAKINATGWLVNNECVQSWEDRNYMQVLLYDGDDSPIDSYDTGEISQHGSWEQHGLTKCRQVHRNQQLPQLHLDQHAHGRAARGVDGRLPGRLAYEGRSGSFQ